MNKTFKFHQIARLAMPGDNVAIATRRLERGAAIDHNGQQFSLDHTVLEGHRFAVQPIPAGAPLLSWGLPFGAATQAIAPGVYVCNRGMLEALRGRRIDFDLPSRPNFEDQITPYILDENQFQPAEQTPPYDQPPTFKGYRRSPNRGVGTRNYIILLGVTSRTGSYVRQLEARLKGAAAGCQNIDGIVAVAHTEGGDPQPNNLDLLLRTLAGFVAHPNVGAALLVDDGLEPVTNEMLHHYMLENGYPLAEVTHRFLTLSGPFQAGLDEGQSIATAWLDRVNSAARTAEPAGELKIALQCGGSDAFSGISGNPLASWVAREIIRSGGWANLAETDELIGAEPYVLQKVKDLDTARKFLATVERFKAWAARHGSSAEGNPSGGNKFRGLYNIVLKSIGAAMKRHPDVRLNGVIEYGQPMPEPGYYFMDSPGNDLESIAGQVAAGSNMIFFVTGNGSITNFPFVPTLKIVTTTRRYELLSQEMDVNAGAYLDGTPMDELGRQMLELTLEIASGRRSVGEKAGHAQVQLWRDWPRRDGRSPDQLRQRPLPDGSSLPIKTEAAVPPVRFQFLRTGAGCVTDQVGLILPTSLCAGQIGRMAAEALNQKGLGRAQGLSRFVSLVHTEGCGCSSGPSEELYVRTLLGYLAHPLVKHGLLLEHGCEKTHNDYMRHRLEQIGLDPGAYGWASVQLDGGIDKVIQKVEAWFSGQIAASEPAPTETASLESLRLGLLSPEPPAGPAAESLARLTRAIVAAGGTVVVPDRAGLLAASRYLEGTLGRQPINPSLAYGQPVVTLGFHIMETPSRHWVETLTGLGATGVELIIAWAGPRPLQGHPLIPVLQVAAESTGASSRDDLDLLLTGDPAHWSDQILQLLTEVIAHRHTPRLYHHGNVDFQITRGPLGISL